MNVIIPTAKILWWVYRNHPVRLSIQMSYKGNLLFNGLIDTDETWWYICSLKPEDVLQRRSLVVHDGRFLL